MLWLVVTLLFLILAAWLLIQSPWGQNWITTQVTQRLSKDLNTTIRVK
ncbi:MAG TPA: hypothetical protein PLV32_02380 [Chitinophagaceae bacterium]|nr:hypothetical protein [Chitinophagaceae bacterium]